MFRQLGAASADHAVVRDGDKIRRPGVVERIAVKRGQRRPVEQFRDVQRCGVGLQIGEELGERGELCQRAAVISAAGGEGEGDGMGRSDDEAMMMMMRMVIRTKIRGLDDRVIHGSQLCQLVESGKFGWVGGRGSSDKD